MRTNECRLDIFYKLVDVDVSIASTTSEDDSAGCTAHAPRECRHPAVVVNQRASEIMLAYRGIQRTGADGRSTSHGLSGVLMLGVAMFAGALVPAKADIGAAFGEFYDNVVPANTSDCLAKVKDCLQQVAH